MRMFFFPLSYMRFYDTHAGEGFPRPGAIGKEDAVFIIVK